MSSKDNRHLMLMDSDNVTWVIDLDEDGTPRFFDGQLYGSAGDDEMRASKDTTWVFGEDGNDILHAYSFARQDGERQGNDILDGAGGDDILFDDEGDNTLLGGAGNDTFHITGGDDVISVGRGEDIVDLTYASGLKLIDAYAEEGDVTLVKLGFDFTSDETLFFQESTHLAIVSPGTDPITLLFVDYFVDPDRQRIELQYLNKSWSVSDLFNHISFVGATEASDIITLHEENFTVANGNERVFDALEGHDTVTDPDGQQDGITHHLIGGGGDDRIFAGDGHDIVEGGTGDDEIEGGAGDDTLNGDEGDDFLVDYEGTNTLNGGAGDDVIQGSGTLFGMTGSDVLLGSAGNDTLYAGDGGDAVNSLSGLGGSDNLHGGSGTDLMNGGDGNDTLYGYGGDDILYASNGLDAYQGGDGHDVFSLEEMSGAVVANFSSMIFEGVGIYTNSAGQVQATGFEEVVGSDYDDVLTVGNGVTILRGGLGNDMLSSAESAELHGGYGNDIYRTELEQGEHVQITDGSGYDELHLRSHDPDGTVQDDPAQLWLQRNGDDLEVMLQHAQPGSEPSISTVTVDNYFANPNARLEEIVLDDGRKLVGANIDLLVSYMAQYNAFDMSGATGDGKLVQDHVNELWTPVPSSN